MASLPVMPASWRRPEPEEPEEPTPLEAIVDTPSPSESISQTPILVDPQPLENAFETGPASSHPSVEEVQRCWICQGDSNEDSPPKEWRRPCPCSLTAHDSCLLEWVSSEEAPKHGDIAGAPHTIVCPQCKAPIKILRPFDPLVVATEIVQLAAKALVIPTAVSALVGILYSGSLIYGLNTMHVVFGDRHAARILEPVAGETFSRHSSALLHLSRMVRKMDPFFPVPDMMANWKAFLGLPLIAPSLVLMRLNLAEHIFHCLPILYCVSDIGFGYGTRLRGLEWPPNPALAFAFLPYVHSLYSEIYKRNFSALEKKWDAAVQRKPRDGETAEGIAAEQDDEIFEVGVEIDIGWGVEEEPQLPIVPIVPVAPVVQQPVVQQPTALGQEAAAEMGGAWVDENSDSDSDSDDDEGPPPLIAVDELPIEQPPLQPRLRPRNGGREFSASIANTVMGAIFLPSISSAMGDILFRILPTKWVTRSAFGSRGFLQEKWGRTIAGGALFVVLKDAVVLYCKWRKARDFGKKKILDYVGKRNGNLS